MTWIVIKDNYHIKNEKGRISWRGSDDGAQNNYTT